MKYRFFIYFQILFVVFVSMIIFTSIPAMTVYASDEIIVIIDGERVDFLDGQDPVIINNRTLVPVRGIFEQLGFDIEWNGNTRQVKLKKGLNVVIVTIDSKTLITNGENHTLDVPAQLINGRTMLPIRAVLDKLGYEMEWDGATSSVHISTILAETDLLENGTEQYSNESIVESSEYKQIDVTSYPVFLEFFNELNEELTSEDIELIKNTEIDDLIMFHFSLGLWIRNNWLWNQRPDCELVETMIKMDSSLMYPDDMSYFLILAYHYYLNDLEFTMLMFLDNNYQ